MSKSMEKLSSGLRINKAADDAAGLAISEKMRAQIRGIEQASRNAQDGVFYIQTAEGAMEESQNILQRMRELAVQAASDTNTIEDRDEIQKEINQLTTEINKIGEHTEYNTQQLLSGTKASISGEVDYGTTTLENLTIDVDSTLDSGTYNINVNEIKVIEPDFTGATNVDDVTIHPESVLETGDYRVATEFDYVPAANVIQSGDTGITSISYDGEKDDNLVTPGYELSVGYTESGKDPDVNGDPTKYDYTYTARVRNTSNGYLESIQLTGERDAGNPPTPPTLSNEPIGNFSVSGTLDKDSVTNTQFGIDGDGWRAQLQTSSGSTSLPASDGSTITSNWTDLNNPGTFDNQNVDMGNGITADFNQSNLTDNNADAVFTVDQESGAMLRDSDGRVLDTESLEEGDQNVMFNNDYALLEFDVKNTDIFDGNVTFDVYNPDEIHSNIQIGANEGQNIEVSITDMRANFLNVSSNKSGAVQLDNGSEAYFKNVANVEFREDDGWFEYALDVSSQRTASANIEVIDDAIKRVSSERSKLGAYQNRLEHSIDNLGTSSENLKWSESRIRDADIAKEMMNQTKLSILAQSSQAMLAKANQQPQGVLQLLK